MREIIQQRRKVLVNTDPQRRCYNGCHASSEWVYTPWEDFEDCSYLSCSAEKRIEFWKSVNQVAIDGRGESARAEFRIVVGR
jgi:hypothetical protein